MLICLNLGCGDTAPEGWYNYDSSWHAQLTRFSFLYGLAKRTGVVSGAKWPKNVRYLSLSSRFPWDDASVDCVYASHVFEHLDGKTSNNFLQESLRVLKHGGILRIVVPDLFYHAKKYVSSMEAGTSGAGEFLDTINLHIPEGGGVIRRWHGMLTGHPSVHKKMYDWPTLDRKIREYGFVGMQSLSYGVSQNIERIRDVEHREAGYEGSLYLEAKKP